MHLFNCIACQCWYATFLDPRWMSENTFDSFHGSLWRSGACDISLYRFALILAHKWPANKRQQRRNGRMIAHNQACKTRTSHPICSFSTRPHSCYTSQRLNVSRKESSMKPFLEFRMIKATLLNANYTSSYTIFKQITNYCCCCWKHNVTYFEFFFSQRDKTLDLWRTTS